MLAVKALQRSFDYPTDYTLQRSLIQVIKFCVYQVIRFAIVGVIGAAILIQAEVNDDRIANRVFLVLLNIWLTMILCWSYTILYRVICARSSIITLIIATIYVIVIAFVNIKMIEQHSNNVLGLIVTPVITIIISGFLCMFKKGKKISVVIEDSNEIA